MRYPLSDLASALTTIGVGHGAALGINIRKKRKNNLAEMAKAAWPAPGASLDLDFVNDRGYIFGRGIGTATTMLENTRNSTKTRVNKDGLVDTVAANTVANEYGYAPIIRPNLLKWSQEFDNAAWSKNTIAITANSSTAPDGTLTADTFTGSAGTTTKYMYYLYTTSTTGTYTTSIYIKAGTETLGTIRLNDNTGSNGGRATFNLSTGTVGTVVNDGTATGSVISIVAQANGWYRLTLTTTFISALTSIQAASIWLAGYTSTAAVTSFQLWGAQLEVGSVATTYYATTSYAPRVDWAALAGKGLPVWEARTNLAINSDNFNSAGYIKSALVPIVNTITAPNGSFGGCKLVTIGTTSVEHFLEQRIPVINGTTYTASCYFKAGEYTRVNFRSVVSTPDLSTYFDLVAGGAFFTSHSAATITYEGNGWYRCAIVFTANASGDVYIRIQLMDSTISPSFIGDNTSGLYIWGLQLEAGTFATPYIPSTTAWTGRASKGGYINSLGYWTLSSYNMLPWSQEFDNASWTKESLTVTANATTAPDGTMTMDKLVESSATAMHRLVGLLSKSTTPVTYTQTVYAKAGGRNILGVMFGDPNGYAQCYFDLSAGTMGVANAVVWTAPSASITAIGSGIYRLSLTATSTSAAYINTIYGLCTSTVGAPVQNYAGNGTSGVYVWGAHLNTGSVAEDYSITGAGVGVQRLSYNPSNLSAPPALMLEAASDNRLLYSSKLAKTNWSGSNGRYAQSVEMSPAGEYDAYTAYQTGTSTFYSGESFSYTSGATYTISIHAKAGDYDRFYILLYGAHFATDTVTNLIGMFNLTTGVATKGAAHSDIVALGIIPMANGWYRCWMTVTAKVTGSTIQQLIRFQDPNAPKYMHFWGAQAEAGNLTSYMPSTDTWTARASTATYVNSAGWIATEASGVQRLNYNTANLALPPVPLWEPAATNLLIRTSSFADAGWGKTQCEVFANTTTAPDGTMTSSVVIPTAGVTFASVSSSNVAVAKNGTYTGSIYVKAGTGFTHIQLAVTAYSSNEVVVFLDLATGVVTPTNSGAASGASAFAVNVGNSWWRVSVSGVPKVGDAGLPIGFRIAPTSSSSSAVFSAALANGVNGVYIWGAQLEVGTYPTSYIPSTDVWTGRTSPATYVNSVGLLATQASGVARLSYNPSYLTVPPALMLEAASTNSIACTASIGTSYWTRSEATLMPNAITAPDGTLTMAFVNEASTTVVNKFVYQHSKTIVASSSNVASIYVKDGGRGYVLLQLTNSNGTSGSVQTVVNLTTGLATSTFLTGGAVSYTPVPIQALPNGVFRIGVSGVFAADVTLVALVVYLHNGSTVTYAGTPGIGVYIWGAQLEAGTYPTSYIPSTDTWTGRASTATYINSAGAIATQSSGVARYSYNPGTASTVIDAASTNLLIRSQEFDNAAWALISNVTITANNTSAPDNTVTADRVTKTANAFAVIGQAITATAGTYTGSVFAKNGDLDKVTIDMFDGTPTVVARGVYSFSTGVVTSLIGLTSAFTVANLGNGWVRFTATINATVANPQLRVYPGNATETTAGYVYLWGAQLEAGTVATSYIPTTTAAVFRAANSSYLSVPPALLLENAATNVVLNSTANCAGSSTTASTGTITGPDGALATKVIPNAGTVNFPGSGSSFVQSFANAQTVGQYTDYSFSGYFAPIGPLAYSAYLVISASGGAATTYALVHFNPTTGVFSGKGLGTGWTEVAPPSAVLSLSGMWYVKWTVRYTQQAVLQNVVAHYFQIGNENTLVNFTADGVSGLQRACHQFEAGSYPTSYIPTTTAQVTRLADTSTSASATRAADTSTSAQTTRVADSTTSTANARAADTYTSAQTTRLGDVSKLTGGNFSTWYRQDQGIWTVEFSGNSLPVDSVVYNRVFEVNDGTGNNAMRLYINGGHSPDRINLGCVSTGAVSQFDSGNTAGGYLFTPTNINKNSFQYKQNQYATSWNGGTLVAPASGVVPSMSQLWVGGSFNSNQPNLHIRRMIFYPFADSSQLSQLSNLP